MTKNDGPPGPPGYPADRFAFRTDFSGNRIVVRPHDLLINLARRIDGIDPRAAVQQAARIVAAEIAGLPVNEYRSGPVIEEVENVRGDWFRFTLVDPNGPIDIMRLIRGMRDEGFKVQPNHVYFVDTRSKSMTSTVNPNFFAPNFFAPNFFAPNFFAPNFFAPNFFAGGGGGDGCCCPGGLSEGDDREIPKHAARPSGDARPGAPPGPSGADVEIYVIDVAEPVVGGHMVEEFVDDNGDRWLDPAAGHGDFVSYIIEHEYGIAPTLVGQAGSLGDIDDAELVVALQSINASAKIKNRIVNLSLSGYNEDDRPGVVLADQIAQMISEGWTVIASAGNNSSCRLAWPAALPGVVAVGAVDRCQPAWFSNYGHWVDASAEGTDVVSKFPHLEPGLDVAMDDGTPIESDSFDTGWATWSGTSFSAPLVTARIASQLASGKTRDEAIEAVLDGDDKSRLPYYGTIVS